MTTHLPIDDFLDEILACLESHPSLVLTAAPGAGKTTRVPPFLMKAARQGDFPKGKILVLEPRRVAAMASALRVADEISEKVGESIGYWVRFEPVFNQQTEVIFLTEALLTRKLLEDPKLKGVSCVILDEFHERSIHTDVAIGMLKELQALERPDLKIIVMSATLDAEAVSNFLDQAPWLEVPGKLFPMEINYDKNSQLLQTGPVFTEKVTQKIREVLTGRPSGDLLVFLPGVGEIERVATSLTANRLDSNIAIEVLHGRLSSDEQKQVLRTRKSNDPLRIILSTNIAESAVTIDGVSVVIDTGLERVSKLHPQTRQKMLSLDRVSKSSATQRAGRSARQKPGTVYRLWNSLDERSMPENLLPEILREDLATTLLSLAQLGVRNFRSFSWLEAPTPQSLQAAVASLSRIGALESSFAITEHGREILRFPLPPELGNLILHSKSLGCLEWGIRFAALLGDSSLSSQRRNSGAGSASGFAGYENDLISLLDEPRIKNNRIFDRSVRQLEKIAAEKFNGRPDLADQTYAPRSLQLGKNNDLLFEKFSELFLKCFPDRLCQRRAKGSAKALMAGVNQNRGVALAPESLVKDSEFFIALDLFEKEKSADTLVSLAVGLPERWVRAQIQQEAKKEKVIRWDEEKEDYYAFPSIVWRGLNLQSGERTPPAAESVASFLLEHCRNHQLELIQKNESLKAFMPRYYKLLGFETESGSILPQPSLKDEWIELAVYGEVSWQKLLQKDWIPLIESAIDEHFLKQLRSKVPAQLELPSGKTVAIHYPEDKSPYVECKVQELFGLMVHPSILDEKITFHLLGPNHRPVQVTSDIPGFWKSSYPEIRKELRIRYPKHYWPEDPSVAEPRVINPTWANSKSNIKNRK